MANDKKYPDDSVSEEASAFGQRVKGAAKDGVGAITGNESLEREGERENAEGRARQGRNDVFDETDGVRGASVTGRPTSSTSGRHRTRSAKRPPRSVSGEGRGERRHRCGARQRAARARR